MIDIKSDIKQQAVCICTDLWVVQTTNTYKRRTLVSAKTAKCAKEKVQNYLSGNKEEYTWPQTIRR